VASIITLGGKACQDPRPLYLQCLEQGLPTGDWWGRANRFLVPRGPEPSRGTLLMQRRDLDALDLNAAHTLVFDDGVQRAEFKLISVAAPPKCVTPGLRGDLPAHYAVEVCDRRARLATVPVDKGYNFKPASGGTDYLTESTDGGTPWTWATMAADLESALGINAGVFPFTPAGTPEQFTFYSSFAWAALNTVAAAMGMVVIYNPFTDAFSYVELGAADAALTAALAAVDNVRLWDVDPKLPTLCRVPAKVRVRFPRLPAPADGSPPWYSIEKSPPGSVTTPLVTGSVEWVDGDMDALGATGTPTNDTDLQTRATEVAAKFYQSRLTGTDPLLRRYAGVQKAAGLLPGKRVHAVAWLDVGGGMVTEVYRGPLPPRPLAVLSATGAAPTTCTLPESATQLAEQSNPDDPATGLAHWKNGDGVLVITLSDECCYEPHVEHFCSDDGTHMISQLWVTYHSNKIKVAKGPIVDGNTTPESWDETSRHACADMGSAP
jgi:hypothetical protein